MAAGSNLSPDQLKALSARTTELRDCLNGFLLYLSGVLGSAFATEAPDGVEGQRGLSSSLCQGCIDGDELTRLSIPKLCISHDAKERSGERRTADATRAYLRDVRNYLQLVRGGDCDAVRCIFVGNTLEGVAKTWYDEWTTARDDFMFDELTAALLARFAPEGQSRGIEARHLLAQGSYHMRSNEMIPAYQSRFEALVTPIANFTEEDRIFWFQRGLSDSLAGECATDLTGRRFQSYVDLVESARGAEMRILARQSASRVPAMQTQDPIGQGSGRHMGRRRGRSARGVLSSGTRRTTGACPNLRPVQGKRKRGPLTAVAMHNVDPGTKQLRIDNKRQAK